MYYYGLGVDKDFEKAKSLYEESRKNGCEEADYKLQEIKYAMNFQTISNIDLENVIELPFLIKQIYKRKKK